MAILSENEITTSLNYDQFTGEVFSTSSIADYYDGSTMDDSKVDNAIYFKSGSEYVKRNYSGPVNVKIAVYF